jgi:hypothetical protein
MEKAKLCEGRKIKRQQAMTCHLPTYLEIGLLE